MRVLLGPAHELHVGVHGSLLAAPPPGATYVQCTYTLRLRPDREAHQPFSPLHDPAVAEWARFHDVPSDVQVVHSSRLPVQTPLPWVVDADSLMTPLQVGRFFALGAAARGEVPIPSPGAVARREAAMVEWYSHRRCARILFRTEYARRTFLGHLGDRGHRSETVEELAAKSEVVYPAVPASGAVSRTGRPVTVLYMGRTAQDKGASVAAEVFARLRERHGARVRLVFLGPCPSRLADGLAAIGVRLTPVLPRSAYLSQLGRADVFLSPTTFESFGMGLLEAAAAGLAIVCSDGPGMEHIGELFAHGENALFVSNADPVAERVSGYTAAVSELIDNEPLRRRFTLNNRALTGHGKLSIRQRNERLGAVYAHAADLGSRLASDTDGAPGEGARRIVDWPEQICHWAEQRCTARIGSRVIG
ncbi:glycosyltransferase [Streptomyces sp. NPDC127068]|uniref:glycosyltransferase n=1 Tax=Streptomyces sp. NPDC127068 TaxID=3347127 RepID=UPI00365838EC